MKPGVFITPIFNHLSFVEVLDFVKSLGLEAIELGTGNYPGNYFVNPAELLADDSKRQKLQSLIESYGLTISALSAHGNPLSPNKAFARQQHEVFIQTIDLAQKMGVGIVTGLSGCPGDSDHARYPNFPCLAFPPEFQELFQWQWEQKVIPYWREVGAYAAARGIRIAIEMLPGFSVYSPATLLKLRHAVGDVIGCNIDPSHLFWQGINPAEAVNILGNAGAIFHCSGKDLGFSPNNMNMFGVLDIQPLEWVKSRSWMFRTMGYGHSEKVWADFISALRIMGYNYVISIENEDPLMMGLEGVAKAAELLKKIIIRSTYPLE